MSFFLPLRSFLTCFFSESVVHSFIDIVAYAMSVEGATASMLTSIPADFLHSIVSWLSAKTFKMLRPELSNTLADFCKQCSSRDESGRS